MIYTFFLWITVVLYYIVYSIYIIIGTKKILNDNQLTTTNKA